MDLYIFATSWKLLCLKVVLFIILSAFASDTSYGKALGISQKSDIESLIINTTGLDSEEKDFLTRTVEKVVSDRRKPWYPQSFSPLHEDSSDAHQIVKLQTLAATGMAMIETVDQRLEEIVQKRRKAQGRWGFLHPLEDIPYQISSYSPFLVFTIKKYDCIKNMGANLPTNDTRDHPDSVWIQYSDGVYVPFKCPVEYDFDRVEALKQHQKTLARLRSKRSSDVHGSQEQHNLLDSKRFKRSDSPGTIAQVNLTITSETFKNTLYNNASGDYLNLTKSLKRAITSTFASKTYFIYVRYFSYRPGSVIATFHIKTSAQNGVSDVRTVLENAMVNNTLDSFTVNSSLLQVGPFVNVCRKQITGRKKGTFLSPQLHGEYPAGAECVWQISVPPNYTIVVQFEDFDLEKDKKCKYDFVAFFDGNYSSLSSAERDKRELLRFCGNGNPPHSFPAYGYPVNSSNSSITVIFKTDATEQRRGFSAIWYRVLKFHLRGANIIPQAVSVLSLVYNPWSTTKNASIPLGKATTCPKTWGDKSCYFPGKYNVISKIVYVFLNRDMSFDTSDPILITFEHILDESMFPVAYTGRKTCVTWVPKFKSPLLGAWTRRGCQSSFSNLTHTLCKCLHTGVFAVIGEVEAPPKDLHIKANIYVSSAVFLILIVATVHSLATKEKRTTGELFHLFETVTCGILIVIFLTGAHIPAEKQLCGFLAFLLYYLVLSHFSWMLLTVLWIQNSLKRHLTERVKINIVYFILGWGLPVILAGVAGKIDIDQRENEDNVCWVSLSGAGTVWGYGAPVFVVLLLNCAILTYLLLPYAKENYDFKKMRPRIAKEILLMLLSVVTWCQGVKMILDDAFNNQYFFCIFLIFQAAVNYNACHESTELFWKVDEEKYENNNKTDEEDKEESSDKDKEEEKTSEEQVTQKPRMTVKTLKNLNIYKENGVFIIEA